MANSAQPVAPSARGRNERDDAHDERGQHHTGARHGQRGVEHDMDRRPAPGIVVEQLEQDAFGAEAADGDRQFDPGDRDAIRAEQRRAEQSRGDEHEQKSRAEPDQQAKPSRSAPLAISAVERRGRAPRAARRLVVTHSSRSGYEGTLPLYPQAGGATKRNVFRRARNLQGGWAPGGRDRPLAVVQRVRRIHPDPSRGAPAISAFARRPRRQGPCRSRACRAAAVSGGFPRGAPVQDDRAVRRTGRPHPPVRARAGPRPFRHRRRARLAARQSARIAAGDDTARL